MHILITAATFEEASFLFKKRNKSKDLRIFYFGKHRVTLIITGVGMVAATYCTVNALEEFKNIDLVINLGLAGSFNDKVKLGDVVQVTEDSFPEMGAQDDDKFISVFDLRLAGKNAKPFKNGMLKPIVNYKFKTLAGLKKCKSITVNTVHGDEEDILKIKKKFNPDIETMEGGAVFYACNRRDIPCIQLRAISNKVERRNRKAWKVDLALKNLKKVTLQLLDELSTKDNFPKTRF